MKAPFPWFGGKRRVAHLVWERFGDTANYVEPFAGSLAVLLARPHEPRAETVNDLDCYLANFWRALAKDPDEVARWADHPVNEADLHARHLWLVNRAEFRESMKTDPEFYDAKIAGWWVWGISQWIGSGWCQRPEWRGRNAAGAPRGIHGKTFGGRKRPMVKKGGCGVHRTRPNLTYPDNGVHNVVQKLPRLDRGGTGVDIRNVHRQLPDLHGDCGASGRGVHASGLEEREGSLLDYFEALAARLRRVRVCCGGWKRILGESPTVHIGTTAVFLDPPYADTADREAGIYNEDSLTVAHDVRDWAIEHGDDPELRIALCGYEGEHRMPTDWACVAWKAHGGYGARGQAKANAERERVWFSPHCLLPATPAGHQLSIEGFA